MKKIFGMLGAAALLTLASCSNENFDEPNVVPEQQGDMFMTMNINQISSVGTRTDTPHQGVEVGKPEENKVTDALVIFATKADGSPYKIFRALYVGESDIVGANGKYAATFSMNRSILKEDIGSNTDKKYYIFVVGNPSTAMVQKAVRVNNGESDELTDVNVQDVFSVDASTDHSATTYWQANHFLMSSAGMSSEADGPLDGVNSKTITAEEIKEGTHTEASDPLKLGTVRIQRAMSRFDLDVDDNNVKFSASNDKNELNNINIEIVGVALVNEATQANLFKVTDDASKWTGFSSTETINFTDETVDNWVFTQKQTAFRTPFFTGTLVDGIFPNESKKVDVSGLTYTTISEIKNHDEDNTYTHPNGETPSDLGAYRIWRYAMENTNPTDPQKQLNGNSTGIVFKAKMTVNRTTQEGEGPATTEVIKPGNGTDPIYAYSNTFLGSITGLRDYATRPKAEGDNTGIYEMVNIRFLAAVDAYNLTQDVPGNKFIYGDAEKPVPPQDGQGESTQPVGIKLSTADAQQLEVLRSYLVEQQFSVYEPDEDGDYYCYYSYWNRHNDNNLNTQMGIMEFATVRNNVYKIKVNKILKLGHPGVTDDDPDPETPPTPDEKDSFYISVACDVLPWEVRINNVDL